MTTTPDHPARQPDVEAWFADLGVAWEFDPDLALHRIDEAASLANQVRHVALDEEVVERYAADMNRGARFPAVIVDRASMGLLGGNHRYAAKNRAHHATTPAYLVTGDALALLRVRTEDNARHGKDLTKAERLDHALALMAHGMSQRDAAASVSLPQPEVSIAAGCAQAARRAAALEVDGRFALLPATTRYQLSQVDDDDVFAPLADLVAKVGMPAKDVKRLVRAVVSAEQHEVLRIVGAESTDWEGKERHLGGNVRAAGRTARARLDGALAEIIALDPDEVAATCPNADVAAVLADRVMQCAANLMPIHERLKPRRAAA